MRFQSTAALTAVISLSLLSVLPAAATPYQRYDLDGGWSYPVRCLTHREISRGLARLGYWHVALAMPTRSQMLATATQGRSTYLIDVDYCDGHIEGLINIGPR